MSASERLKEFCRSLPGTTEDIKWGADQVFSVGKKMYAAFDVEDPDQLGFKCSEQDFLRLTQITGIIPAPYAARFGWVKVERRGALSEAQLQEQIRRSYELVVAGLPKGVRARLPAAEYKGKRA